MRCSSSLEGRRADRRGYASIGRSCDSIGELRSHRVIWRPPVLPHDTLVVKDVPMTHPTDSGSKMPQHRVLVLAPYLTAEHAGAAQSTITILRALSRADWAQVTVAAYTWDESLMPPNVRRVRMPEATWPAPSWRLFPLLDYWQAVRALRASALGAFDLCYTQSIPLGLAYRRLHPRVPIASHPGSVLWSREVMEESEAPVRWRRLSARIARWLENRTYRETRWVHFASSKLVADIRADSFGIGAETFQVAPLPVDPTRFTTAKVSRDVRAELGLAADDFVVITVARLVPLKRIDAIIRAVASISRRLVLLVVGDGPERERLQKLAAELGAADRIRFVGRQDPPPYLAAANLFVLPSLVESFGLAYVEAMMMGLPCIGLRYRPPEVLSAASEIIGEGEFGFCVDTDEELRARIDMLAANPAQCRTLGERARSVARARFTPDGYVGRLRDLVGGKERVDIETVRSLAASRL